MSWIVLVAIVLYVILMIAVLNSTTMSEEERAQKRVTKTFKDLIKSRSSITSFLRIEKGEEVASNYRISGNLPPLTNEELEMYQASCFIYAIETSLTKEEKNLYFSNLVARGILSEKEYRGT